MKTTFVCANNVELTRAKTSLTKEPGTVQWIQDEAVPGDVFYDIGANIGVYSFLAAQRIVPGGVVFAFEPHLFTAISLLQNVHVNKMTDVVKVLTCALNDKDGFLDFNYRYALRGTSGSQLGHTTTETGVQFIPALIEIKYATTVDHLIKDGVIQSATLVKIDVDGNELNVLSGMTLLLDNVKLRSVQVEVHGRSDDDIRRFMFDFGFNEFKRHFSSYGQEALDKGIDPKKVFCNVIFRRNQ